ncbi:hypothetical protein [Aquamicrobium sp. LC103]|uniref:hypothetical protein n=1 Tax=Aquamicrobium sp. LC103 TaxID=1120658 RepID=UPI000AF6937F|nr:hypothetical protein [Aquamicrobium sp. LC103]TKT80184.1 hypothetical protein XW59_007510 [Aquamicrobium sp. LC103]
MPSIMPSSVRPWDLPGRAAAKRSKSTRSTTATEQAGLVDGSLAASPAETRAVPVSVRKTRLGS